MMFELQKPKKTHQKALHDIPSEWNSNYDFKQESKPNFDDQHKTLDSLSKNHDISKTDDNLKQLLNPKLNRMATIYLKNPLNNMKKNEKKFKNELKKIPKTLKEEMYFRTKSNNKANNEVSFPEVTRSTPQKPHKNEDLMKHNIISNKFNENIIISNKLNENPINSNKMNEITKTNSIPQKRISTHSNNSLLDFEKKTIVN